MLLREPTYNLKLVEHYHNVVDLRLVWIGKSTPDERPRDRSLWIGKSRGPFVKTYLTVYYIGEHADVNRRHNAVLVMAAFALFKRRSRLEFRTVSSTYLQVLVAPP